MNFAPSDTSGFGAARSKLALAALLCTIGLSRPVVADDAPPKDAKKYEKLIEKMYRKGENEASKSEGKGSKADRPPAETPAQPQPQKPKLAGSEKFLQQVHDQLKPTDEEWAVLAPRVERVHQLEKDVEAGTDSHGVREPRSDRSDDPSQPTSEVLAQAKLLNEALLDPLTSPTNLRDRIEALRQARDRARQNLRQAQADLRDLLTARQEATLIIMGVLD